MVGAESTGHEFQSTPSAWRVTGILAGFNPIEIFQSTPSAWRVTHGHFRPTKFNSKFQSTPSAWRVTAISSNASFILLFQSTPSAWRVTDSMVKHTTGGAFQSTPSAWRVTPLRSKVVLVCSFQSTPSAWRVTARKLLPAIIQTISIHTLRMEGDHRGGGRQRPGRISIHTLRMEGDTRTTHSSSSRIVFQSTPSAWRVTRPSQRGHRPTDFNPHPPHGG